MKTIPIPLVSGIDQSAEPVIGAPRITRCERVRLVSPGKLAISPGYYQVTPATDMRAVTQVGNSVHVISSSDGWFATTKRARDANSVDGDTDEAIKWHMPAFEAPIRINFPGAQVAGRYVACWAAPKLATTPSTWAVLTVQGDGTSEYPSLFLLTDTQIAQQVSLTQSSTTRYRLATDYSTGHGYLINADPAAHTVKVYSFFTGDTPLTVTTYTAPNTMTAMVDVAVTTVAGKLRVVVLDEDGFAHAFESGTATYISTFDANATAQTAVELALYGNLMVRSTIEGLVRVYNYTTGAAQSTDQQLKSVEAIGVALSKMPVPSYAGGITISLDYLNTTTGDTETNCYLIDVAAGTPTTPLSFAQLGTTAYSAYCNGAPLPLASNNVYQSLVSSSPVLRSLELLQAQGGLSLRATRALVGCSGEMPLRAQVYQCKGSHVPSASPVQISYHDSLCGELRTAYVIPAVYVNGGQLASSTASIGATVLVVTSDSTALPAAGKAATVFDGLCPISTGRNTVAFTSCAPWLEGDRAIATGFLLDGPAPKIAQVDSAGGTNIFTPGDVYQYVVRAEYRDPSGTLYRSAPTQPVSHTVTAPVAPNTNAIGCDVILGWQAYAPDMPGAKLRVYRTVANGTVFYDTGKYGAMSQSLTTIRDSVSDADLIDGAVLTEGVPVTGGLKAKYGIPPCRFGWRGKDRVIVGGVEQPNRVRWSQLIYPGEALCFPHASELGWTQDFDDAITAVAALDDAWIVFTRTKIYAVFGSGPDDNGLSGSFEPPRLISPNCGCLTWRSVAEIAEGLLFQAPNSQIYLLQRGQLTLQWYSAAVRTELESGMIGSRLRNPIVATVPHQAAQTIHFVRAPMPDGSAAPPIVFDRRTNAWTTDGDTSVEGLNGALTGAAILDNFSVNPPTPELACDTIAMVTPTYLTLENATGTAMSPLGMSWTGLVETNDIAPFDLAGWGQVRKVGVVAQTSANTSFGVNVWRSRNHGALDETVTIAGSAASVYPYLGYEPAMSKMSAIRVQITWSDRATYPAAIVLEVEPANNGERTSGGRV